MNKIKIIISAFVLVGLLVAWPSFSRAQTAWPGLKLSVEKKVFAYQAATSSASVVLDTSAVLPSQAVILKIPAFSLNELAFFYGQACPVRFGLKTRPLSNSEKASYRLGKKINFFSAQAIELFLSASSTAVKKLAQPLLASFVFPPNISLSNIIIAAWHNDLGKWQSLSAIAEANKLSAYVQPGQTLVLLKAGQPDISPAKTIAGVKVLGLARSLAEIELEQIKTEARQIASQNWLKAAGQPAPASARLDVSLKRHLELLAFGLDLTAAEKANLDFFAATGTKSTRRLGAGERVGVLASYKRAYGSLPAQESQWLDLLKIARGRWPSVYSAAAEAQAGKIFALIYRRQPDKKSAADQSAIKIMAYGLRPWPRRLAAEKRAAGIFIRIFKHQPLSAADWDIVRAIAYSGAVR